MKKLNIIIATPSVGTKNSGGGISVIARDWAHSFKNDKIYSVQFVITRGNFSYFLSPIFLLKSFLKIIILKFRKKADLAHVHASQKGSTYRKILLCKLLKILNIPYILHIHGSDFHNFFKKSPKWIKSLILEIFKDAKSTIVLGKIWKDFVSSKIHIPKKKIYVLNNTAKIITLKKKNKKNKFVKIIFLGKLSLRKGTYDLIYALNKIKNNKKWNCTIVGDGDIDEIKALIKKLNISDRIKVTGWLSREDSQGLLINSNILVLPSYAENMPLSVIEGMAFGLSIITTPVGATPEIINNNKTGIMIKPGNVVDLSKKLQKLINSKKLQLKLGKNAKKYYLQKLSYNVYQKKLKNLWKSLINSKN